MKNPIEPIKEYYRDRDYFRQLVHLAAPIALQNLINNSLSMVGSVMIGQLGDAPMAAVALAAQVFFLLNLIIFGIGSGSAMFTAQLWGNKDIPNLRKVLGLCLILGIATAGGFLVLSELFPTQILGIFSTDPQVIALGSIYLRMSAWGFIFFAITAGFSAVLRSIGEVKLPMTVNLAILALNMALSYLLIFGKLGLPPLGIQGAAIAVLVARLAECFVLLVVIYAKKLPVAAGIPELMAFNMKFLGRVFRPVFPVILNELFWSLGISAYSVVYARIGTPSIAAMNIVSTVDNLAFVPFLGLASATAIMTGNSIGAGEAKVAFRNVGRTLGLTAMLALLMGIIVLFVREPVLSLYQVTDEVILNARYALFILSLWMIVRSQNTIIVVGMLRSGGDTRFSLFLDGTIIWILGVPMAVLGGLILHLPVYWVYLFVMSEELTKCILGLRRYFSRKWIHNLASTITP